MQINWKPIISGIMIFVGVETAIAQTAPDYDQAARHADRAVRAYKDLQLQKQIDQGEEALADAMIHLHVCKPMHDQTALSRREYIATVINGRGKQKAVAQRCAAQELWYSSICQPKTSYDADYNIIMKTEASCPAKWEEFPPVPPIFSAEYDQRISDIERLYR